MKQQPEIKSKKQNNRICSRNINGRMPITIALSMSQSYIREKRLSFLGSMILFICSLIPISKILLAKLHKIKQNQAKTFKKSLKTKKYTITLKTNQNKPMKNVKVTIKINKKTYKATTNAKGKATFKIKKLTKKGKYTATIKFAGNKNYKATSAKVKITVKK